jgi:hypothetical protein
MKHRTRYAPLTFCSVILFVAGLLAEFRASLYGAGADTPIVQPELLKVQIWLGLFGLLMLAAVINALATQRRRAAMVSASIAAVTWGTWVALGLAVPGGGWP